jgi:hypothetical protein
MQNPDLHRNIMKLRGIPEATFAVRAGEYRNDFCYGNLA